MSLGNAVLAPLTGSPVESPTLSDHPVKGPADLLHRNCLVIAMAENNIDVVVFESLEGVPHAFDDVLAGKSNTGGLFAIIAEVGPEYFGR